MLASDSTRRAVRTVLDLVPAFLAALAVLVGLFDFDAETVAKVTAAVGAVTVLCAKVRNALEDAGYIPALLKAPASEGADPVPNDHGAGELGTIGILLLVVGVVLALFDILTTTVYGLVVPGMVAIVIGLVLVVVGGSRGRL